MTNLEPGEGEGLFRVETSRYYVAPAKLRSDLQADSSSRRIGETLGWMLRGYRVVVLVGDSFRSEGEVTRERRSFFFRAGSRQAAENWVYMIK